MNEKAKDELQVQINNNKDLLKKCENEIKNLKDDLNFSKDNYEATDNFIESLEELLSYLKINEKMLINKQNDINKKSKSAILPKDILKEYLLQKQNLLETLKKESDKEIYRRSLKILIYDLVDKIICNEDKSLDIIFK